jgi:hypothetical protein
VLSQLCGRILNRRLFKIILQDKPFTDDVMLQVNGGLASLGTAGQYPEYFFTTGEVDNTIYSSRKSPIRILMKNGQVKDITEVSETIASLKQVENQKKYFLLYPRELTEIQH